MVLFIPAVYIYRKSDLSSPWIKYFLLSLICPRSIILFVFSVLMQYSVVSSNEDVYRIAQLTYLKETDTKTRVFNKNKYVEMMEEYYFKLEQIAVLFWDLNNLKYMNDVYGHAVGGDKAIETLSEALLAHAGDSCRVYRIGGDEFLMILDNPQGNEGEDIIQGVQEELELKNRDKKNTDIFLAGVSMGAASAVMSMELELPENVRAVIADCGYPVPGAIIMEALKTMGLPVKLFYLLLKQGAHLFGHFDLEEATALQAVQKSEIPILFIHGGQDSIVPLAMGEELYQACGGKKNGC